MPLGAAKIIGAAKSTLYTVTQGKTGDNQYYGYDNGVIGSVNITTLKGVFLGSLYYDFLGSFYLSVSGAQSQDFFLSCTPQGSSRLLTANADTFDDDYLGSGNTLWLWNGSKPAAWDGTGNVTVLIDL